MTASQGSPNGRATCYHGATYADSSIRVIAHDARSGWRGLLVHFGPADRFAWGRVGPGANDLALSIMADVLGPSAICPGCDGRKRVVWKGPDADEDPEPYDERRHCETDPDRITPCVCDTGLRPLPVDDFVLAWVTSLPNHWSITRDAVLHWMIGRHPVGDVPQWLLTACGLVDVELPEPS